MAGASLQDLANEIVNATRVMTDGPLSQPGQLLHVSVIPGFSPVVSATETLTGGTLGSVTGALAVDKVDIAISYAVKKADGIMDADVGTVARTPAAPMTGSDVLDVAFLLQPPVGENTRFTLPSRYHVIVTVNVSVEGIQATRSIDIPVSVPALQIPAIAVLGRHAMTGMGISNFAVPVYDGDSPNWLLVMVRAGSPAQNLGQLVSIINELMEVIQTLQAVLDFTGDFATHPQMAADARTRRAKANKQLLTLVGPLVGRDIARS